MHTHIHTYMGTKTISISDQAYERLLMKKKGKESFSEVVVRLTNDFNILDYAGIISDKEAELIKREIEDGRKRSRKRAEQLENDLGH